jgi:hypothetical protein
MEQYVPIRADYIISFHILGFSARERFSGCGHERTAYRLEHPGGEFGEPSVNGDVKRGVIWRR